MSHWTVTSWAGLCLLVACSSSEPSAPESPEAGSDASSADAALDDGGADATTDANTNADASLDAGDGGACLAEGSAVAPTGSGTCADPYVIDLSTLALGTVVTHTAAGGADAANFVEGGACKVSFKNTARDWVYRVKMPQAVASLDVGARGVGADPRVGVAEDPSCGQPLNACADAGGAGVCEVVHAPRNGSGFFGTETFVVVAETVSSNQAISVSFQAH